MKISRKKILENSLQLFFEEATKSDKSGISQLLLSSGRIEEAAQYIVNNYSFVKR